MVSVFVNVFDMKASRWHAFKYITNPIVSYIWSIQWWLGKIIPRSTISESNEDANEKVYSIKIVI